MNIRLRAEQFGPEKLNELIGAADDLLLLVEVIEAGGFSAASVRTGVSKSRLSRRIASLEEKLGVNLLLRTSRNFEVTEIGEQLYQHGRSVRSEVHAAMTLVHDKQGLPHGPLRVACPVGLETQLVGRIAAEFALAYPDVRLSLSTTKGTVESQTKHADLVLLPSDSHLPDSDMIVQKVACVNYILVAAPTLIVAAGHPKHPDALSNIDVIAWGSRDESTAWHLVGPGQEQGYFNTRVRFSSDNLMTIYEASVAGLGVARLPEFLCRNYIAQGRLGIVLPGWAPPPISIYALYPSRRHISIAGKLFLTELVKHLQACGL